MKTKNSIVPMLLLVLLNVHRQKSRKNSVQIFSSKRQRSKSFIRCQKSNKKSPATQRWTRNRGACLNFESPVTQNQSSEGARRPAAKHL